MEEQETTEEALVCPVCGTGTVSEEEWRNNLSGKRRTRALWATPYKHHERAWIYDSYIEKIDGLFKIHGVVESVQFGHCGSQGIETGLSLTLKNENRRVCGWTFYSIGDIAEFMDRAKAQELNDLIGTPIIGYSTSERLGGSIVGIDVVDSLVLDRTDDC